MNIDPKIVTKICDIYPSYQTGKQVYAVLICSHCFPGPHNLISAAWC